MKNPREELEIQFPTNQIPRIPYEVFQKHCIKYGNTEWKDISKLRKKAKEVEKTQMLGYISEETSKNLKKWLIPNPGKLYVVSWYHRIRFLLPTGLVIY